MSSLRGSTERPHRDPRRGLAADTSWNLGALALLALTGVVTNLFVVSQRGREALGVLSQVYSVYIVVALVAAFGVHDSAQKHAAEHAESPLVVGRLACGALAAARRTSALVALGLALAAPLVGMATDSPAVGRGILLVAPGVWLFGINKTLLGVLNGLRRMRAFALAQAVRALGIVGGVVGIGLCPLPDWALGGAFVAAEILVLAVARSALAHELRGGWDEAAESWRGRHLRFGSRALVGGLLGEAFLRIDVVVLGLFLGDAEVGVYGFAAFFAEGLAQIPVVVRTVVNPVLVRRLTSGDAGGVARLCRRAAVASVALTGLGAATVLMLLPWLGSWLGASLVTSARELLGILLVGLVLYSAFLPSDNLLLQAGLPGRQSALMAGNVLVSVLLNALLIARAGARGAALATALAYGWSALALTVGTARWLGMTRTMFFAPGPSPRGARRRREP